MKTKISAELSQCVCGKPSRNAKNPYCDECHKENRRAQKRLAMKNNYYQKHPLAVPKDDDANMCECGRAVVATKIILGVPTRLCEHCTLNEIGMFGSAGVHYLRYSFVEYT